MRELSMDSVLSWRMWCSGLMRGLSLVMLEGETRKNEDSIAESIDALVSK